MTSRTPRSQVAATKPARSVVDAAAEADHRVGAGEAGGAEHGPAARGHLGGLGRLAVGHVDRHRLVAASRRAACRPARRPVDQGRRVDHGDPLHAVAEQRRAARQQAVTDQRPRTAASAAHRDPGRVGHRAAPGSTIRVGAPRPAVSVVGGDDLGGHLGVQRLPLVSSVCQPAADVAQQQRPGGVQPDPLRGRVGRPTWSQTTRCPRSAAPGRRRQHRSAAQRQHAGDARQQLGGRSAPPARGTPARRRRRRSRRRCWPARSTITASASRERHAPAARPAARRRSTCPSPARRPARASASAARSVGSPWSSAAIGERRRGSASQLRRVSATESPPNFSSAASASTSATMASATTPAAGTAHTSERWWWATAASPVATSTVRSARGTVEIGFIAARTRSTSPLVMPPSMPPARLEARAMPPAPRLDLVVGLRCRGSGPGRSRRRPRRP